MSRYLKCSKIAVLFYLTIGLLFVAAPSVAQSRTAKARMVNVDGHAMNVMTAGFEHLEAGQPVVVFESGAGIPLQNWDRVFTEVAAFAPVVAYDRVGIGGTAWDGKAPTPERVIGRLHALLEELDAPPPYVLVGHSWGGALIHYFAGRYPNEIAGLVYIDPPDVNMSRADGLALFEEAGAPDGEAALKEAEDAVRVFLAQAPEGVQAEREVIRELVFERDPEERGLRPVPDVPTAVLLAGRFEPPPRELKLPFDAQAHFEAGMRLRMQSMSKNAMERSEGLFIFATHASHLIHGDDPALVTDAIRRVVFPDVSRQLRAVLEAGGATALDETYRALVRRYPSDRFNVDLLNTLGYELLNTGKVQHAVAVFELNVEMYPKAPNPHDSLGEGYEAAGLMDEARASYDRAVELAERVGHPGLAAYRANLEQVSHSARNH